MSDDPIREVRCIHCGDYTPGVYEAHHKETLNATAVQGSSLERSAARLANDDWRNRNDTQRIRSRSRNQGRDLHCAAAGRLEWTQEDAQVAVDEYNRTMEASRVIEGAARRLAGDLKPAWDKIQEAR